MKKALIQGLGGALLLGVLSIAPIVNAETVVQTTTNAGTISEFSPDALVIRSETATEPVRYSVSKSVTYVDEDGAPVSAEVVKSGVPVTVHYIKEGGNLVANRVVVRRKTTTTTTAPVIEERKSTTTTTTTSD